ncbi:hypothetical protein H0H93_010395 [Arthromyces matolae]|nr:hypothetical protein H0H93_010395 [Arthromyces matolae]
MPGVTVLPQSPGLPGFGSPQLGKMTPTLPYNQPSTTHASASQSRNINLQSHNINPVTIKEQAISHVRKETQGTSSSTMLAVAQKQYRTGRDHETNGDLVEAYKHFVMAATLVKSAMDHPDAQRVSLWAEMDEALKNDLKERIKSVEEKLKSIDTAPPPREPTVGTSIADRKKALEAKGLIIGSGTAAVKRISRNLSELTPPHSPNQTSPRLSTPTSGEPAFSFPATPQEIPPSPRSVVSTSTLAPSPPLPSSPIASFSQSFPSIEEIEAPFNTLSTSSQHDASKLLPVDISSSQVERSLSMPGPANFHLNRTGSATQLPLSRPSSAYSLMSSSTVSQLPSSKPRIPVSGTTTVEELLDYLEHHRVLLLDVRTRLDFESGHIEDSSAGIAIACVEPSILHENLTLPELEQAMLSAPTKEVTVFSNREKFEIVVLYDDHSRDLGASHMPLSILNKLLDIRTGGKLLKRQPMLLVGGFSAWRRAKGKPYVESTVSSQTTPSISSTPVSRAASTNPFYVNAFATPPVSNHGYVHSPPLSSTPVHRSNMSVDYSPSGHARFPAETSYPSDIPPLSGGPMRRPAIARHSSTSSMAGSIDNLSSPTSSYYSNLSSGFSYPALSPIPASTTLSGGIASPPQASIKQPSQLSRKRTDYDDPSQDAVSDLRLRAQIAYPVINPTVIQPPPPAASSALERQDTRPRLSTASSPITAPGPLRIPATVFPIGYWNQPLHSPCGLHNLGNTCYMNATLQCLYATAPFLSYFKDYDWQKAINMVNPLGSRGLVTRTFEILLKDMFAKKHSVIKERLTRCLGMVRSMDRQYEGWHQHDSQEFLTFLLDKIHEDMNRVLTKPVETPLTAEQEQELEFRDPRKAIDEEWIKWRNSNDSIIVDLFQGQFKNRLQCLTCRRTSTTYNAFSILQLSIPYSRSTVTLQDCLSGLFRQEELRGDNRWDCPSCKGKRDATQRLSLARLPPVLVIHLKRFQTSGSSAGKIDTLVQCPTKNLEFLASPDMPDEFGPSSDPRTQIGPYKYDLYAVTNHRGELNSGHYTAYVQLGGDWRSISDERISALSTPVVTNEAYVLFYKRVDR